MKILLHRGNNEGNVKETIRKEIQALLSVARITTHHTGNTQLRNYCLSLPFLQKVLVAEESRKADLGGILILYPLRLLTLWIKHSSKIQVFPCSLASLVTGITNSGVLVIERRGKENNKLHDQNPSQASPQLPSICDLHQKSSGDMEHGGEGRVQRTQRT